MNLITAESFPGPELPGASGQLQRIDFQRSDIRWVTKSEKSQGTFQLEAVLRLQPGASTPPALFALGAGVLAGNMYVDDGLAKDPPYLFQIAVGASHHVIFRTDLSRDWLGSVCNRTGERAAEDTMGPNRPTFDCLDVNLNVEPAKTLQDYDEIAIHYSHRNHFTSLITLDLAADGKMELEFPIKHLNLLPSRKMWQVETGPVLFMDPIRALSGSDTWMADLLPCFLHFNRVDRAEFSPDFPFAQRRKSRWVNSNSRTIDWQVRIFVNSNSSLSEQA